MRAWAPSESSSVNSSHLPVLRSYHQEELSLSTGDEDKAVKTVWKADRNVVMYT